MPGLHHVTAIAGSAAGNLAFYRDVLGLRLIKQTVNFDDPGTHHLYFGDHQGSPGSILTFFPHEQAAPGRVGVGQVGETVFAVPQASLGFWTERFIALSVPFSPPEKRFGETVLSFQDRDGTRLALVALAEADALPGWTGDGVGTEHAIRGIRSVTLWVASSDRSAAVLTGALGFREAAREGNVVRHQVGTETTAPVMGGAVDLRIASDVLAGRMGAGSVHHVAFRAASDEDQAAMSAALADRLGIQTTEQMDRCYFRSVYFREPSGVIFEIATDAPGFATDETIETLGSDLRLPSWLEGRRADIKRALPPLGAAHTAA
ncbi:MAG: ring-cleaving dioxygenase [Bosea sp. (in: a-proteobacteria)]